MRLDPYELVGESEGVLLCWGGFRDAAVVGADGSHTRIFRHMSYCLTVERFCCFLSPPLLPLPPSPLVLSPVAWPRVFFWGICGSDTDATEIGRERFAESVTGVPSNRSWILHRIVHGFAAESVTDLPPNQSLTDLPPNPSRICGRIRHGLTAESVPDVLSMGHSTSCSSGCGLSGTPSWRSFCNPFSRTTSTGSGGTTGNICPSFTTGRWLLFVNMTLWLLFFTLTVFVVMALYLNQVGGGRGNVWAGGPSHEFPLFVVGSCGGILLRS